MGALTTLFTVISLQQGLPPGLLSAVCFTETRHVVNAIHLNDGKSHSYGICQIKLVTAQQMGFKGTPRQLMEPKTNILFAAKYLRHQIKRYKNVKKAVIAYNQGHAGDLIETAYQNKVYAYWGRE